MEASGLCHTDIHAANGDWPVTPTVPFIPGHEGVGIVTAVGEGVTSPRPGQRVAVPWLGYACGTCQFCLTGWETLCLSQQNTGYSVDGCYAEYFLAEAAFATPVPAGLDPREAAPLTCAGVTTYKAVKVGDVRPGNLVAISGIGGLGHLALQYARSSATSPRSSSPTRSSSWPPRSAWTSSSTLATKTRPRSCRSTPADSRSPGRRRPLDRDGLRRLRRGGRLVLVARPRRDTAHAGVRHRPQRDRRHGSLLPPAPTRRRVALHAGEYRVIFGTRPKSSTERSGSGPPASRTPAM